jgi:hypothetical protein
LNDAPSCTNHPAPIYLSSLPPLPFVAVAVFVLLPTSSVLCSHENDTKMRTLWLLLVWAAAAAASSVAAAPIGLGLYVDDTATIASLTAKTLDAAVFGQPVCLPSWSKKPKVETFFLSFPPQDSRVHRVLRELVWALPELCGDLPCSRSGHAALGVGFCVFCFYKKNKNSTNIAGSERGLLSVMAIDCGNASNVAVCRTHDITGFPTLKVLSPLLFIQKKPKKTPQSKTNPKHPLAFAVLSEPSQQGRAPAHRAATAEPHPAN